MAHSGLIASCLVVQRVPYGVLGTLHPETNNSKCYEDLGRTVDPSCPGLGDKLRDVAQFSFTVSRSAS